MTVESAFKRGEFFAIPADIVSAIGKSSRYEGRGVVTLKGGTAYVTRQSFEDLARMVTKDAKDAKDTKDAEANRLKREWYDKIASGEKTVEYRRICDHWRKRVWFNNDTGLFPTAIIPIQGSLIPLNNDLFAVFRLGYSRKYPDIVRRITKIDIGPCPYDGWDGDYFRINFEREDYK